MSLFKMFGGGKSSAKSKGAKNTTPGSSKTKQNEYGLTAEEMAEAERSLPVISNRKDRLSVSRSGRHKVKGKQRMNLQDDTYATHGSIGAPFKSSATPSYNPAPSTSHSQHSQNSRVGGQGSLGRTSQQGSLGRNCGVATDTKRYQTGTKNIPRQQTAV